jgi:hypothetical protein
LKAAKLKAPRQLGDGGVVRRGRFLLFISRHQSSRRDRHVRLPCLAVSDGRQLGTTAALLGILMSLMVNGRYAGVFEKTMRGIENRKSEIEKANTV